MDGVDALPLIAATTGSCKRQCPEGMVLLASSTLPHPTPLGGIKGASHGYHPLTLGVEGVHTTPYTLLLHYE